MNKKIIISLCLLIGILLAASCTSNNEEDLYPPDEEGAVSDCDTLAVTYSGHIVPVLATSCSGCHSTANANVAGAGIILDTYAGIKIMIDNERFWGSVNHDAVFSPMPKGLPKMDDCSLAQIELWLAAGAPEN